MQFYHLSHKRNHKFIDKINVITNWHNFEYEREKSSTKNMKFPFYIKFPMHHFQHHIFHLFIFFTYQECTLNFSFHPEIFFVYFLFLRKRHENFSHKLRYKALTPAAIQDYLHHHHHFIRAENCICMYLRYVCVVQ